MLHSARLQGMNVSAGGRQPDAVLWGFSVVLKEWNIQKPLLLPEMHAEREAEFSFLSEFSLVDL